MDGDRAADPTPTGRWVWFWLLLLGGTSWVSFLFAARWIGPMALLFCATVFVAIVLPWRSNVRAHDRFRARRAGWWALGPPRGAVWRRLYAAEGLGHLVPRIAPSVRVAVRLSTRPAEAVALGQSRIGGTPDLPATLDWPRPGGGPLNFLAQLDLEEVARVLPEGPLPPHGHLWFFHDPGPHSFKTAPQATVLYDASGAALQRAPRPERLPKYAECALYAVDFEAYEDIPGGAAGTESDIKRYLSVADQPSAQKLLGYPDTHEGHASWACQLAAHGLNEFSCWWHGRTAEMKAGAGEWRLLFQLDVAPHRNSFWGADRFLFWICEQDLRAHRFDQTRVTLVINC